MTTSELFLAGKLREAIESQTAWIKANPADQPARFLLFELYLFAGDLDRCRRQLDLLRYEDPRYSAAVEQYRFAIESETIRRAVFAGTEQPKGLATAPDHVRLRLEALQCLARGEAAEAHKRLDEANAAVPAVTGTLILKDGQGGEPITQPFESIYDADGRFGTVLEVFGTRGVYSWVPLEQIQSISLATPRNPRDFILRPAHVMLRDGLDGDVLLPALYPDSYLHADDPIKLGQATEWLGAEGEVFRGAGARVFFVGDATRPLAGWERITFA